MLLSDCSVLPPNQQLIMPGSLRIRKWVPRSVCTVEFPILKPLYMPDLSSESWYTALNRGPSSRGYNLLPGVTAEESLQNGSFRSLMWEAPGPFSLPAASLFPDEGLRIPVELISSAPEIHSRMCSHPDQLRWR